MLVWVTGSSGAGKSTACANLRSSGFTAIDADWEGYCGWTDRATGDAVDDPPYPAPSGWLNRYGWTIDRAKVEALAAESRETIAFLCGLAENETDVRDLFDLVLCLVLDDRTLRERLATRTTNAFGQNPEELAAALQHNARSESAYRQRGAIIIDATLPPSEIVDLIVSRVARLRH
jgi:dephospho-CoA kinase